MNDRVVSSPAAPDANRALVARDFSPTILTLAAQAPSPLPRALLWTLAALVVCTVLGALVGRLDMIAVAHGRLVPQNFLKIVQPAESGVVRELLVQEGDAVTAGQVLVRMDPRLSDADTATVQGRIHQHRLQLRRIDAELSGAAFSPRPDDPPNLVAQVNSQYRAHRQSQLDAVATETAIVDRSRNDLQAALETEAKLAKTLPIHREQAEGWETLAREGFAGKLLALERKRALLEAEQELKAQRAQVESLRAGIAQSERRVAQLHSTYRRDLQDERSRVQAELDGLLQDSARLSVRQSQLELRAPAAGVVKELATHTAGTVVQPGTVLMTIVPTGEAVQAEVWIDQIDAGFVEERMPVELKVATFPFQKFGTVPGQIRYLSPDAADSSGSERSGDARSGYRALIALDTVSLQRDGKRFALAPGMQVSAEIHLGTRSVMEYLMSPVQKTVTEAAREQ
jgi:HlyD family secretion protein